MRTDKLSEAILTDRWRRVPSIEQVALINMADRYVRDSATTDLLPETLMVIMVQALCGVGAEEARVIVDAEIEAALDRRGR